MNVGLKYLSLSLCAAIAAVALASADEQALKPRLAVFPFRNQSGDPGYEAACLSATNELRLSARQLDAYEIVPPENEPPIRDRETLRAWAMEHDVDFIAFGSIKAPSPGSATCSISLFDRAKGRESVSRESPPVPAMSLLEAADELISAALGEAVGRHIGFGQIAFKPDGAKGSYRCLLDGAEAGSDVTALKSVLAGTHTVSVLQNRMLGETELLSKQVDVEEGATVDVGFEIPSLTDNEKKKIDSLEETVRANRDDPASADKVDEAMAAYESIVKDDSYSASIDEYRDRERQLAAEWTIRKNRYEIEASAWEPSSGLLAKSGAVYLAAAGYPDPDTLRGAVAENASILATFLELAAGKALAHGDYSDAQDLFDGILGISHFLKTDRMLEYAYAASTLSSIFDSSLSKSIGHDIATVFNATMKAGIAFNDLKPTLEGQSKLAIIVPSNQNSIVLVDNPGSAAGPLLTQRGTGELSFQTADGIKGPKTDISLSLPSGERFAFIDTGFSVFGRLQFGTKTVAKASAPKRRTMGALSFDWLPEYGYSISLNSKEYTLIKNFDGSLNTESLAPGWYRLKVKIGHAEYNKNVRVLKGRDTVVDLPPPSFLVPAYTYARTQVAKARPTDIGMSFGLLGISSLLFANVSNSSGAASTGTIVGGSLTAGLGFLMLLSTPSSTHVKETLDRLDEEIAKYKRKL
ncbi:MAG: hypothetical protein ABSF43_06395 [Rectinemataceae bacterium]|jgi:hypothetical protein